MKHVYRFMGRKFESKWCLDACENEHLSKVLRLQEGERIEIADGAGNWASGKFYHEGGRYFLTDEQEFFAPQKSWQFEVALSFHHKATYAEVVPALVELGCDRIWFYPSEKTPKHVFETKHLLKLQSTARAAFKQSKRAYEPFVDFCMDLEALIHQVDSCFVFDHLYPKITHTPSLVQQGRVLLCIGSESGWDQELLKRLVNFDTVVRCKLDAPVLRAKTAAIAIPAWFSFSQS